MRTIGIAAKVTAPPALAYAEQIANELRARELDVLFDEDTAALLAFNKKVHDDERVENILLPVRDGLLVARKK